MAWVVDDEVGIEVEWLDGATDNPVTSGAASVQLWRVNGGAREYLQADLTTFDVTPFSHALTESGGVWELFFTVPSSMAGHHIVAEATHSDAELPPYYEDHRVTEYDIDDVWTKVDTIEQGSKMPRLDAGG